jgi:hypothetical protein
VRVAAADQSSTGSLAYHNPAKDLNNRIDAPVESEEALYGVSGPAEKGKETRPRHSGIGL